MRNSTISAAAVAALCLAAMSARAQVPATVPVQGVLTDASGAPVTTLVLLDTSIYDVASGGSALYTQTQGVTPDQGAFTVYLGTPTVLNLGLFDGRDLWLGIKVGTDAEMTPRFKLGSVPYAAYAGTADTLDGLDAADLPDQTAVEAWARGVCYDAEAELTALLDDNYAGPAHTHNSAGITDNTLTSSDILDGTLATADLANNAVNSSKLFDCGNNQMLRWVTGTQWTCVNAYTATAPVVITGSVVSLGSIGSANITDGSIANADMATNSVGVNELEHCTATGQVFTYNAATTTWSCSLVVSGMIADGTVGTADLADGTIASGDVNRNWIQTGRATPAGSDTCPDYITVTFATAFAANPVVTLTAYGTNLNAACTLRVPATTSSFDYCCNGGTATGVNWIAVYAP